MNVLLADINGLKKMKILLISANRYVLYGPVAPLGLAAIATHVNSIAEVKILDLAYSSDWEKSTHNVLSEYEPDIVGVSIRNIDNSDYMNYENYVDYYIDLINYIKRNSQSKIILGGVGFSFDPEQFMNLSAADYGVIGYGEETFYRLVSSIIENKSILEVPNIIVKKDGVLYKNNNLRYNSSFNNASLVDRSKLEKSFLRNGDMGNIEATRGCKFKCAYCVIPNIDFKFAVKDYNLLISELNSMREMGYTRIFFVDNILNFSKKYFNELCNNINYNKLNDLKYQCQIDPKEIDEETVKLAKEAGFHYFQVGALSCCDEILELNGKNFRFRDLSRLVDLCIKYDIKLDLFFSIGAFGDNEASVLKTIKYMRTWEGKGVSCGYAFGLRIFENTRLYKLLYRESKKANLRNPEFYISDYVKENTTEIIKMIPKKYSSGNIFLYEILTRKLKSIEERNEYLGKLKSMVRK